MARTLPALLRARKRAEELAGCDEQHWPSRSGWRRRSGGSHSCPGYCGSTSKASMKRSAALSSAIYDEQVLVVEPCEGWRRPCAHRPVRSRCLHPGQQQGRRWPSSNSSWVLRMLLPTISTTVSRSRRGLLSRKLRGFFSSMMAAALQLDCRSSCVGAGPLWLANPASVAVDADLRSSAKVDRLRRGRAFGPNGWAPFGRVGERASPGRVNAPRRGERPSGEWVNASRVGERASPESVFGARRIRFNSALDAGVSRTPPRFGQ